jgi:hypothetical protein
MCLAVNVCQHFDAWLHEDPLLILSQFSSLSGVLEKLWLTIGIPTVPRRNDMDYLMT